jgi:thymidylate kinase
MFTVALIGPDGAGKTTIGRRLEHELPLPVKYVYMGINTAACNHMLPTTRLARVLKRALGTDRDQGGPRDPTLERRRPKGFVRRLGGGIKSALGLCNRLAEECYRQIVAWNYTRRRNIVIFDRHYFPDYYAYDIARDSTRSLAQRIHGFFLARLYPRPHLMILLDAPAEVLWARKCEGTPALLERRRLDYLRVGEVVKHFVVVDAARPEPEVAGEVRDVICRFYHDRQKQLIHKRQTNRQETQMATDGYR